MCLQPITLKNPKFSNATLQPYLNTFKCGACSECNSSIIVSLSFRLNLEMKQTFNNTAVLLTYNDNNLPKDNNLSQREMQLFNKRLRRNVDYEYKKQLKINPNTPKPLPIKYFGCGEYGGENNRAHYHLLILNCPSLKILEKSWNKGHVFIKPAYNGDVGYLMKYLHKKSKSKELGLKPEFKFMSYKLGYNYLTPQIISYHNRGLEFSKVLNKDGTFISMPRIYKSKIYDDITIKKLSIYQRTLHELEIENKAIQYAQKRKITTERSLTVLELQRMALIKTRIEIKRINVIYDEYIEKNFED